MAAEPGGRQGCKTAYEAMSDISLSGKGFTF